jgi:hypothetical protein
MIEVEIEKMEQALTGADVEIARLGKLLELINEYEYAVEPPAQYDNRIATYAYQSRHPWGTPL